MRSLVLMASLALLAAAPAAKPNLMAKVPIQLGYYVHDFDKCSSPGWVTKFGPNSVTEISDDGASETKLASVKREEVGYWLQFAGEFEEQDPHGIQLRSRGPGRIEVLIQDNAMMHFCRPEELPAKFRK